MPTSPAFPGVRKGVFLLLGFTFSLLFSLHRGVSKTSHERVVVDNQNLQSIVSEPKSHQPFQKRDAAADYEAALRTGGQMWAKIQAAFDGCPRDRVQNFEPSALENGWSKNTLHIDLDAPWREYIEHEMGQGKGPRTDQATFIEHTQNKDFTNKQGQHREALSNTGLEVARYRTYYLPSISTVVIKNMRSPATVVKEIFRKSNQPLPSNERIGGVYAPPLSRWSDVTWTVYEDLATASAPPDAGGLLRFIGHDQVSNAVSRAVMIYIIRRHRPPGNPNARPSLPFPGLEFGVETAEGQALLGTPNGMGTGWVLHDRGRELGRRSLK
ncbi:MAG: hypothetical protein Q9196_006930, partial [Gyalolechia fulgens]